MSPGTPTVKAQERPAPFLSLSEGFDMLSALNCGVFVPEVDETYYITDDVLSLFNRIMKTKKLATQRILLKGPHGAGKTELAMQFAARTKSPLLIMDCANLREPRDWFGYKTVENSKILWHESVFDKVVSAGNHVILLDEVNRVHPAVMNALIPLLDDRGFTYLEEKGSCISVGEGTVFFSTMNEGSIYTGTTSCDLAVHERLGQRIVEVTYLPTDLEIGVLVARTGIASDSAKALVDIANQIRSNTGIRSKLSGGFSTRQLINCAKDFVIDGPESLTFTLANMFSSDGGVNSERASVLQLMQGKFGVIEAKPKAKVDPAKLAKESAAAREFVASVEAATV